MIRALIFGQGQPATAQPSANTFSNTAMSPTNADLNGRRVGVFVCRFRYIEQGQNPECQVFAVARKDLELAGRSDRRAPKTRQGVRR
jgi:hypothetical protein